MTMTQVRLSIPTYEDLRLAWRRSLNEYDLRSLTSEYLRGRIDDCTTDAFKEFEERFGPYEKSQQGRKGKTKKAKKRRK